MYLCDYILAICVYVTPTDPSDMYLDDILSTTTL
jgi:hypothetical protein